MTFKELPLPPHFDPNKVGDIWRVPYEARASQARQWTQLHQIPPSARDTFRISLVAVDVQNTFCIPGFELYVGGRSGCGAVDDNIRLCEFIYHNLTSITEIAPTLDTHSAMQIFHPTFLIDAQGRHPPPLTTVSAEDIRAGRWKFNPALADTLGVEVDFAQQHLAHYTSELEKRGKYELTIWPYHAMLGGIGHALVSAVEEAFFFHSIARYSKIDFIVKGDNPLTEHYSAVGPEVLEGPDGKPLAQRSHRFLQKLELFDAVIIAGQAKSHCVAWTINDLLEDIRAQDESLVKKVYLLEDCTSPVVVPGVVDFTEAANEAFRRFEAAGMHVVRSTDPLSAWPDLNHR
jgi:nicotinamidase-related amidase